jgi:putative hydrolase of the HAD superfamily
MIDAIVFDFGDVFINLNKNAVAAGFKKLGLKKWHEDLNQLNLQFEKGEINRHDFLNGIKIYIPDASITQIEKVWNSILADFPLYRLEFLQKLSKKYRLFLLSNTDAIHIANFEQSIGTSFYSDFYDCFEKVYFSFEIGMRKPDSEIYEFVLNDQKLVAKNTLFIDDKKENTDAALSVGMQVWHLQVGKEDVLDLYDKKLIQL